MVVGHRLPVLVRQRLLVAGALLLFVFQLFGVVVGALQLRMSTTTLGSPSGQPLGTESSSRRGEAIATFRTQNVPELFAARRIFQGWKFVVQAGDAGSDSDSDPGSDS